MFERFTERARQVVVLAQDEARGLRHNYIGTEHILLGLLREEKGLAARALEALGVELNQVRSQVGQIIGQGDEVTTGQIPFMPRAKRVLEHAAREAKSIGHNDIGTAHILLGLARETEGVASRVLLDYGADAETIRNAVLAMLEESPQPGHGKPIRSHHQLKLTATDQLEGARALMREPLIIGLVVAALGFPLGLLVGWLIWA